ncbi:hypothetical protein [Streptomyces cucumeris]|uniref:hypothetical protein n=1 Tax=Streptomyces cucumeris TaxID=2962890 RepID=UPI003D74DEA4
MTARDVLETNIDPAVPADMARRSIDDFATEVLRKAAAAVVARSRCADCAPGREAAAEDLHRMADEAGTPALTGADPAADFFRVGRTYAYGQTGYRAPELTVLFLVEHVTRHPDRGHLRAIGWSKTGEPGAKWHGDFQDEDQFEGWAEVTEGGGPDA